MCIIAVPSISQKGSNSGSTSALMFIVSIILPSPDLDCTLGVCTQRWKQGGKVWNGDVVWGEGSQEQCHSEEEKDIMSTFIKNWEIMKKD